MKTPYMKPLPVVRGCHHCQQFSVHKVHGFDKEICAQGKTFDKRFPYVSIPSRCVDKGWFVRRAEDGKS